VKGISGDSSADQLFIDGGGWDTISDNTNSTSTSAISMIANDDVVIRNISANSPTGAGGGQEAIELTGTRGCVVNCKVVDSDNNGIEIATQGLVSGCIVLGADADGIRPTGANVRIIASQTIATGDDGCDVNSQDDCIVYANVFQSATGSSIEVSGDNNIAVGNRLDGAPADTGTSNTIAANDEATF